VKFGFQTEKVVDVLEWSVDRPHKKAGYWQTASMEAGSCSRLYCKKYLRNVYISQIHHGIFPDVRGVKFLGGVLFDNAHMHVGLSTLSP
jgi:hypothetical protein